MSLTSFLVNGTTWWVPVSGFQKCVGDLWGGDDFSDFSVVVEGTTYRCHRFILAACSGFFQGLFRSQMKECHENSVRIGGIDKTIFDVVINSVYRGVRGITIDNFMDVWKASEQLQIGFLVDECQRFAKRSMCAENCFEVLNFAKTLASRDVTNSALIFIARKFQNVNTRVEMMRLSFDEFYTVINSDRLEIPEEELVLKTIINWCRFDDTDSSTVEMGHELGVFDEWATKELLQKSESSQTAGVKSEDSNNNVTDSSFFSIDSLNVNPTDKNVPTKLYMEPEGTLDENMFGELTDISTLASPTDIIFPGVEERSVATASKRSHSLTGLDDGSDQVPKCKIRRLDRRLHLCDLIRCCRLYLVNSDYLQQMLESNQMITSCPETRQMLARALGYSLDVGRRHDCWPAQAIRRKHFDWRHVMLYCHNKSVCAHDLTTGCSKIFHKLDAQCYRIRLAAFNNSLFAVLGIRVGQTINFSACRFTKEDGFKPLPFRLEQDARMLAHGGSLYFLTKLPSNESELCVYRVGLETGSVWRRCASFHVDANCLVRLNQYILVFHTTDVVVAECYDTKTKTKKELSSTMDGTSVGMTSFKYNDDVFLLQTNGSLWKITESVEDHKIEFELVTRLWDDYLFVLGLVMFESKLHLFVNKDSVQNVAFSENTPTFLPQMVRIPLDLEREMVPMVVPSRWLWGC